MFRVFNTLNVWVLSRFSLGRHSSLVRSYICAVNTTDKTLRLAFSHVLSLPAKYLCETTRDICLSVVVVRVFRPWNADAFVQALPLTAEQISVATVSSNVEATGAMLADVVS